MKLIVIVEGSAQCIEDFANENFQKYHLDKMISNGNLKPVDPTADAVDLEYVNQYVAVFKLK